MASQCVDIVRRDMSVCVFGTKWSAGVSILSEETCRCVSLVASGQPVCRYCPNRLVGACVFGTKWPAGVSILSEKACRCVSMVLSGQPVCRYCLNRHVGVCLWYQVASRCVDIV